MKTLLLLRHAKSDWNDDTLDDHDRPLNERGLRAAPRMGRLLAEQELLPDLCLTSTALRSVATAELAREASGAQWPVRKHSELYDFGNGTAIQGVVQSRGGAAGRLLVVGHNPSMESFALRTCREGDNGALNDMKRKYPTAALAVIEFELDDWSQLDGSAGYLRSFWRPATLD